MIRNVVSGRLRDNLSAEEHEAVDAALAGIGSLDLPGQLSVSVGRTLDLRPGGWDLAIVNDWRDADAYRNYDLDPEHNEYRAVIGAACAEISRVQIEV